RRRRGWGRRDRSRRAPPSTLEGLSRSSAQSSFGLRLGGSAFSAGPAAASTAGTAPFDRLPPRDDRDQAGQPLRGRPRAWLRRRDVLEIGRQVADALEYSHAVGIVHRDIKHENLLVARLEPEVLRVRITDFGLAIAMHDKRITKTGFAVGTVAYCSPEQVRA